MNTGYLLDGSGTDADARTPFDIWAMKEGVSYCFECKSCRNELVVSVVKPHQIVGLLSAAKSGAKSFLVIELRKRNKTYLLPIQEFVSMVDKENKRTISEEDLELRGKRIE